MEPTMSRTLAAYASTFGLPTGGTAPLRRLARTLRRIARDHALALRAAAQAEQPRKRRNELRRLYTLGA
jgi:hypothetical protein